MRTVQKIVKCQYGTICAFFNKRKRSFSLYDIYLDFTKTILWGEFANNENLTTARCDSVTSSDALLNNFFFKLILSHYPQRLFYAIGDSVKIN